MPNKREETNSFKKEFVGLKRINFFFQVITQRENKEVSLDILQTTDGNKNNTVDTQTTSIKDLMTNLQQLQQSP